MERTTEKRNYNRDNERPSGNTNRRDKYRDNRQRYDRDNSHLRKERERDGERSGRNRLRSRSRSPPPSTSRAQSLPSIDLTKVDPDDEESLMKAMGFSGFGSTKGKHVVGNDQGAVDKARKTEYRQILHKKKNYEVPLTRQQLEEKEKE